MTPKNAAFAKEFPWLEGYLKTFSISLHGPRMIPDVQRMDERLLDEFSTRGIWYDCDCRQNFLLLTEDGSLIASTLLPFWQRALCTILRLNRCLSVFEVLHGLSLKQLSVVYYVVQVRTYPLTSVTIHKPPKGYTVREWLELRQKMEEQEMAQLVRQINTV